MRVLAALGKAIRLYQNYELHLENHKMIKLYTKMVLATLGKDIKFHTKSLTILVEGMKLFIMRLLAILGKAMILF